MVSDPVRVLIVDDHAVVRLGLAGLLATDPSLTVVGEAAGAAEALEQMCRCRPDVVIMDVRLPDGNGIDACRAIHAEQPQTRVLMLTGYSDREAVVGAIMAGAAGYLLKQAAPSQVIDAVKVVAEGGYLLDPAVTKTVLHQVRDVGAPAADDPFAVLSEHERRLLPLIAEGKTNRQIAAALCLSEHTVKTYMSEILRKLRLRRRAELAALIARHALGGA